MENLDIIFLILKISTTLIMAIGVIYAGIQLSKTNKQLELTRKIHQDNHEWNRRNAAQSVLRENGDVVRIIELHKAFDLDNVTDPISIEKIKKIFKEKKDIQIYVNELLNLYEKYAIGIFNGLYDEKIIKDAAKGSMSRYFRVLFAYIKECRKDNSKLWCEYESLIDKWKHQDSEKQIRDKTGN